MTSYTTAYIQRGIEEQNLRHNLESAIALDKDGFKVAWYTSMFSAKLIEGNLFFFLVLFISPDYKALQNRVYFTKQKYSYGRA